MGTGRRSIEAEGGFVYNGGSLLHGGATVILPLQGRTDVATGQRYSRKSYFLKNQSTNS